MEEILRMEHITKKFGEFYANKDINLSVLKGEVHTLLGENGAGKSTLMNILFGLYQPTGGQIYLHGKQVHIDSPATAVKLGIGMVHQHFMLVEAMTVFENIILGDRNTKGIFIDKPKEAAVTQKYVDLLKTKTPGIEQLVENLSGGNQQKVVIAKWLVNDSQIMIFDEPTRGIDVGAKQEIYELMNQLAESGKAIIMISSELAEILRMSDRIVVMCEGRKTGEFDIAEATQEKIRTAATRDIDMQNVKTMQEGAAT